MTEERKKSLRKVLDVCLTCYSREEAIERIIDYIEDSENEALEILELRSKIEKVDKDFNDILTKK